MYCEDGCSRQGRMKCDSSSGVHVWLALMRGRAFVFKKISSLKAISEAEIEDPALIEKD